MESDNKPTFAGSPGTLSRADKIMLGNDTNRNAVFTLQQWVENSCPSSTPSVRVPGHSHHRKLAPFDRTHLLLIKAQESALNFLARWMLLDDTGRCKSSAAIGTSQEKNRGRQVRRVERKRPAKKSRSSLLLSNVPNLSDRGFPTIMRFIFWRWLTWANVIELLLIVALMICCIYQCYELLEDYFNYPTHVSMTKNLIDDFKEDLPGVTICNNNRMSKETLKMRNPDLNVSHFMAITLGTYYSVNNFSLPKPGDLGGAFNESDIDWVKVAQHLSKNTIAGSFKYLPMYDLVDTVTCANIWGEQMPCENFKRVDSIQQASACVTLFHDSAFWDLRQPAVQELEVALRSSSAAFSGDEMGPDMLLKLDDDELELERIKEEDQDPLKIRIEMSNMEVLRMRINFKPDDYAQRRSTFGGLLSIHSKSQVAKINHINYDIEPGFWYSYYLERFDYHRLPPPYETNCHDYEENRYNWQDHERQTKAESWKVRELIQRQLSNTEQVLPDYARSLQQRTLGIRDCMHTCIAELSSTKCNCWDKQELYLPDNYVDVNGTMTWCDSDALLERPNASSVAGDGLFFQVCAKEFFMICMKACPDECNFLSFDVTVQSRSWPSHESRRYITDQRLLTRLKVEGECCATISVLYASPSSSHHITEPKYTRQDMVTIISGNIEAWIGLSAVHAYLFLEQFYDALVEAQLVRPLPTCNGRRVGLLLSILTQIKARLTQVLAYLFYQLARLFCCLSEPERTGAPSDGR